MKSTILLFVSIFIISSCNKEENNTDNETTFKQTETDFKQKMRGFVIGISQYSKTKNPIFLIIPQNGIELVSSNGDVSGQPHASYLDAIDANGQEDLFYGYDNDDQATSETDNSYLRELLDISKNAGNKILVTDYCSTTSKMTHSYFENSDAGYTSFAANSRELNNIPTFPTPINQENNLALTTISQVENFLYLINPSAYSSKIDFINAITATNYDGCI